MDAFERIDRWLLENHMSRRQLALKAGIPPSSFQSAMERRKKISDKMLQAIAPIMGMTVEELVTESKVEFPSGGTVKILNHPDMDSFALNIENLSLSEVLTFCKLSRAGGVSEGLLHSILVSAVQYYANSLDLSALETIVQKMIDLSENADMQSGG